MLGACVVLVLILRHHTNGNRHYRKRRPGTLSRYNGQATGTALAQVLWGDVNPSGVLPFTVYPEDYISKVQMSDMRMRADASSGYPGRTYRFYTGIPLYPFGHGGSYTTWELKWSTVQPPQAIATTADLHPASASAPLTYAVVVTNTGKMAGAKVVQLYVAPPAQLRVLGTPAKSLFGMQKVTLGPGKSTTVSALQSPQRHRERNSRML